MHKNTRTKMEEPYATPKSDVTTSQAISEKQKINIFSVANFILSLPIWFNFLFNSHGKELYLVMIILWHSIGVSLYIKSKFTRKVVIIESYLFMLTLAVTIIYVIGSSGIWLIFLNPYTYLIFVVLYLQYQYINIMIGFVRSDKTNEYYLGNST